MKTSDIAAARDSGARRHAELLGASGGTCSSIEAAVRLGLSEQVAIERADNGHLVGLRSPPQRDVRFPVFQFSTESKGLIPGLDDVLAELRSVAALDPWAKCNFMLSPRDSLQGETPLTLLKKGQIKRVIGLARAYAS